MADATQTVQVVVRVRPMSKMEEQSSTLPVVTTSAERREVAIVRGVGPRQSRTAFTFDDVFSPFATQAEVFQQTIKPMIGDVLGGFEATIFAYGQVGVSEGARERGSERARERGSARASESLQPSQAKLP